MKPEGIHPTHDDLFAYRDGELPAERRTLIEAHVVGCQACRSVIDEVSGLEAALRRRPEDAGAAYFERLPDQVLERIRSGESAVAAPASEAPRPERRRAAAAGEAGEERAAGRPRFKWGTVLTAASAAAAVVVVVVLLVKRGPLGPEVALQSEESRAPAGESTAFEPAAPGPEAGARAPAAPAPSASSAQRPAGGVLDALRPIAKRERAAQTMGDLKSNAAPPAADDGDQKLAQKKDAALGASSAEPRAQREAPLAPVELGGALAGRGEYADLIRRHRLPPLWSPTGVSSPALLRAEPELRYLYQTGRAGSDSARIRLYLAEAARIRYAGAPDSALHDAIVHHYLRAIRLGRTDSAAAQVARERLETFAR